MIKRFNKWLYNVAQTIASFALITTFLFGSVSLAIWSVKWFLQLVGVM